MKITDSPYMVMVNRIYSIELQILLVTLSHENAEMERAREREERLRWWKEQYKTRRKIETEEQQQSRLT